MCSKDSIFKPLSESTSTGAFIEIDCNYNNAAHEDAEYKIISIISQVFQGKSAIKMR